MLGIWSTASLVRKRLKGLLILPDVMGHRPGKLELQGSTVVRITW